MKKDYSDILYFPRPHSPHKKMAQRDRAAQFAPFAALNGHHEAILETQRLTDENIELSEEAIISLNEKIQILKTHIATKPYVSIVYFVKDQKKKGGYYIKKTGNIKQIDELQKRILFLNKEYIQIEDIISIDCELFPQW